MNSKIVIQSLIIVILCGIMACDKKEINSTEDSKTNTLNDSEVGNGNIGVVRDYFYDFENNIHVEFYQYRFDRFSYSYQEYFSLFRDPIIVDFKTFPKYLMYVTSDNADPGIIEKTVIDSLTLFNQTVDDSVKIFSASYKDILSLDWDFDANRELQRYILKKSKFKSQDSTIYYIDTINTVAYRSIASSVIESGMDFIDSSEWVFDSEEEFINPEPNIYQVSFFINQKIMGRDSLVYRINGDLNENGLFDAAGTNDTLGNRIWDPEEGYVDSDGDGKHGLSEPFQDRNQNGSWDQAEHYTDQNSNGKYDSGEPFIDQPYGIFLRDEQFTDMDNDNIADSEELFYINEKPNQLLISYDNYPDLNTYRVLTAITYGDSIIDRWGNVFHNLIDQIDLIDKQVRYINNTDSVVTLYTNKLINHVDNVVAIDDYFITKTEWKDLSEDGSDSVRFYDYHIFKDAGHIYKLFHKSYFNPYGYNYDDFWFDDKISDNIFLYAPNGLLRDGEYVEKDTTITTGIATYHLSNTYQVESDVAIVPAKKVKGFINENNDMACYGDPRMIVSNVNECPSADTTFTDCFKVTMEGTMVMIGSGVTYGEKNILWLVKDYGIVKSETYRRWGDLNIYPPEANIEEKQWLGFSRLELRKIKSDNNSGLLNKLLGSGRKITTEEFPNESDLDFDPYIKTRTSGLHRITIEK